jgi:hypothetical protein
MAIWQQSDIDSVKAALSSGTLSVTYAGPPARSVTYQSTAQLMALLASMVDDVNTSAGTRTRYRLAVTRSGL